MRKYWMGKYADTRSNYWVCLPQSIPLLIRCAACKLAISTNNPKHYLVLLSDLALSWDSISAWRHSWQTTAKSIASVVRMWERLGAPSAPPRGSHGPHKQCWSMWSQNQKSCSQHNTLVQLRPGPRPFCTGTSSRNVLSDYVWFGNATWMHSGN